LKTAAKCSRKRKRKRKAMLRIQIKRKEEVGIEGKGVMVLEARVILLDQ
jgi:hypothetical protein